jgi:hypothetical protein
LKLVKRSGGVICLLCLVLFSPSRAQQDNDEGESPALASLTLRFDKQSGAVVDFWLPKAPENLDRIRQGLSAALHCPASSFRSPVPNEKD